MVARPWLALAGLALAAFVAFDAFRRLASGGWLVGYEILPHLLFAIGLAQWLVFKLTLGSKPSSPGGGQRERI